MRSLSSVEKAVADAKPWHTPCGCSCLYQCVYLTPSWPTSGRRDTWHMPGALQQVLAQGPKSVLWIEKNGYCIRANIEGSTTAHLNLQQHTES
jgi:hypothetical protein